MRINRSVGTDARFQGSMLYRVKFRGSVCYLVLPAELSENVVARMVEQLLIGSDVSVKREWWSCDMWCGGPNNDPFAEGGNVWSDFASSDVEG